MKKQTGFIGILILVLAGITILGGGVYMYTVHNSEPLFEIEEIEELEITTVPAYPGGATSTTKQKTIIVTPNVPALQEKYDDNKQLQYTSQRAALTAGMAEARYKAEIQPAGYAEVCTNIEGWILSSYNEGSYDEGTRINRYEQQTKINGLVCVNSKDKYALSLPVPQNDGSLATKCMDSSGFFDTGSIDTAFMSCKK